MCSISLYILILLHQAIFSQLSILLENEHLPFPIFANSILHLFVKGKHFAFDSSIKNQRLVGSYIEYDTSIHIEEHNNNFYSVYGNFVYKDQTLLSTIPSTTNEVKSFLLSDNRGSINSFSYLIIDSKVTLIYNLNLYEISSTFNVSSLDCSSLYLNYGCVMVMNNEIYFQGYSIKDEKPTAYSDPIHLNKLSTELTTNDK